MRLVHRQGGIEQPDSVGVITGPVRSPGLPDPLTQSRWWNHDGLIRDAAPYPRCW
ncbi:hypothetical protein [Streptomyces sp. NBC_00878]|uniref:hypothetical protein n=1 Tax=Streptomyces sp. NBC_00878 TaxID=2975854 RepID=UPI002252A477|nr:hypothetical protein [Streptomyces sp. NBC_00878]MCX4904839.1 hypothetical protein [Streptomyces sp. NBC_00878]